MNHFRIVSLVLLLSITVLYSCNSSDNADILISNINVVNLVKGELVFNQDVFITEKKITKIQPHDNSSPGSRQTIDGTGKYLMPGLWDMHVHTGDADIFFPLYVANGITGIRDMGGGLEQSSGNQSIKFEKLAQWRNEVKNGNRIGPEILLAGSMVDGTPSFWPGSIEVTDSLSIYEAIKSKKKLGVDFIKVYHNLNGEQLRLIAQVAKEFQLEFEGHLPSSLQGYDALLLACELEQSSIEHLFGITQAVSSQPIQINSYLDVVRSNLNIINRIDIQKEKILFDKFIEHNMWFTATLAIYWGKGQLDQPHSKSFNEWLQYIPERIITIWYQNPFLDREIRSHPAEDYEIFREAAINKAKYVKRMYDSGINLMAGSDSAGPMVIPGYGLHLELSLMVDGGFSPIEALRTATINPAKFLKREDIGIVDIDYDADLIILNGNPLIDISNTRLIDGVILKGKYIDRSQIDLLLKGAKEKLK